MSQQTRIILASASERRKAILRQAGIPFEAVVSDVDEAAALSGGVYTPDETVRLLSEKKAAAVEALVGEPCIIIAADTVVSIDGNILGKPQDGTAAAAMLRQLQGRDHFVYTGVTMIRKTKTGSQKETFADRTKVTMRPLTESAVQGYVKTGEPFDKAGGYAIQGKGMLLVSAIAGDYYNVVGLPLVKVYAVLQRFGFGGLDMIS